MTAATDHPKVSRGFFATTRFPCRTLTCASLWCCSLRSTGQNTLINQFRGTCSGSAGLGASALGPNNLHGLLDDWADGLQVHDRVLVDPVLGGVPVLHGRDHSLGLGPAWSIVAW